jgi:hypothetical protein
MADVVVELSGNEKKLLDSYRRLAEAEARQLAGIEKVAKKSKEVEDTAVSANDQIIASVGQVALQYLSVTTAMNVATAAFQKYQEQADNATRRTSELEASRQKLRQVFGGNIDVVEREANQLSATTGLNDLATRQLFFSAQSAGFYEDKDLLQLIARGKRVVDPEAAATMAGVMTKLLGVSPENSLDLMTIGAKNANMSMAQFAPQIQAAMASGQRSAVNPYEITAALAMESFAFTGSEGQKLNAFLGMTASNEDLRKKGLIGQVQALQDETLREEVLKDNKEAISAFEFLLRNLNELIKNAADTQEQVTNQRVFANEVEASYGGRIGQLTTSASRRDNYQSRLRQQQEDLLSDTESDWATAAAAEQMYINKRFGVGIGSVNSVINFGRAASRYVMNDDPATYLERIANATPKDAAGNITDAAKELLDAAKELRSGANSYSSEQRARSQTQKDPG